jgi:hypothetical protein
MCAGTVVEPLGPTSAEVRRLAGELGAVRLDQHVGENRYGVAALDHAMHVAERLQQRCAFDGDLHVAIRPLAWNDPRG